MEIESTSTAQTASPTRKASWRDRVATGLMLMSAVGAFVSFISAIGDSVNAGPATQVVEIWRMYGFCVFGGLFLLLAIFPRRYPGIWELVILDKAALAVTGLVLLGHGVKDALTILIADGTLALVIVLAYILTRGYSSWGMLRMSESKQEAKDLPAQLCPLLPVLPFLIAWHIIAGLAIAPINPLMRTVMQERLPAEMRARVFGTMIAGIPLGILLSGYGVTWFGLQATIFFMGALTWWRRSPCW